MNAKKPELVDPSLSTVVRRWLISGFCMGLAMVPLAIQRSRMHEQMQRDHYAWQDAHPALVQEARDNRAREISEDLAKIALHDAVEQHTVTPIRSLGK